MTEFAPKPESRPSSSSTEGSGEKRPEGHEQVSKKHDLLENIDEIRRSAEYQSVKAEDLRVDEEKNSPAASPPYVDKQLKNMAYSRLLTRARKQLNPLEKPISKFMHQPAVDALSETVAKTIGRPSGILGGGLVALAGTSVYYYIAKHYGYDYNFFVFIFLLAVGFMAGWSAEVLFRLRRKQQ